MPTPIAAQTQHLRQIRPGWMEPDTPAPDHDRLDWFQQRCERHYPDDAPIPRIFPTPEGKLSVERHLGEWGADVEVDLTTHHGIWGDSNTRNPGGRETRTQPRRTRRLGLAQPPAGTTAGQSAVMPVTPGQAPTPCGHAHSIALRLRESTSHAADGIRLFPTFASQRAAHREFRQNQPPAQHKTPPCPPHT